MIIRLSAVVGTARCAVRSLPLGLLSLSLLGTQAAVYQGNGDDWYGGAIGLGTLNLTANGDWLTGRFHRGGAATTQFANYLVVYIDSVPGGFADTTSFSDNVGTARTVISGYNGILRAPAYFAGDFRADYAIVLNPDIGCQLFQLAAGGAGSLIDLGATTYFTPRGELSAADYTFDFHLSDIGVPQGSGFRFQSIYAFDGGSHTLESFETLTGTRGWGTINFTAYNTFPEPVPEMTNVALPIFAALLLAGTLITRLRRARSAAP